MPMEIVAASHGPIRFGEREVLSDSTGVNSSAQARLLGSTIRNIFDGPEPNLREFDKISG